MNKLLLQGGSFAAALMLASIAAANEKGDAPRWYVSPGVGMMFFEGNQAVDEGLNMVLRLGYDISEHWSAELGVSWAPNITSNGSGSDSGGYSYDYPYGSPVDGWKRWHGGDDDKVKGQSIRGIFLDGLYHFDRYSRFDPFLSAGFGYYRANDRVFCEASEFSIAGPRVGAGLMYHLTDNWSLRADGRAFMALDQTCEFLYTVDAGVAYHFGGGGSGAAAGSSAAAGLVGVAGMAKDSDGDGLTDEDEINIYRTDPFKADTDGDGLSDGDEVLKYKTDPLNADTDYDGLSDGDEVLKYKTNPLKADTDGGGVSDGHEVLIDKTNPLDPSDDLMMFELFLQFDYDTTVIKPEYFGQLDQIVRVLAANPNATAIVEGHADRKTRSKESYNKKLSEDRATAVKDYMVKKGINTKRLSTIGYGFHRPKVQPDHVNGNPENRRVEIYIRGAGSNADKIKYVNP